LNKKRAPTGTPGHEAVWNAKFSLEIQHKEADVTQYKMCCIGDNNYGRIITMAITEPIRNKKHVLKLTDFYLRCGRLRNHCLITLCVHTALRISDVLRLTWDDVYDFTRKRVRKSIVLTEKKTGKTKSVALNKYASKALAAYARSAAAPSGFIIANARTGKAICRVQAYRIIRCAGEALDIPCRVSCHSLRKTFGYHSWKNGVSPAVIMEIYNYSSFAVTRRYLGVTQDDKDDAYLRLDFSA
jgi:integrase